MMLANSGFRAWVWQRFSAVYLGLYILAALLMFTFAAPHTHAEWIDLLKHPFVLSSTLLFIAALGIHAWVGIRDIILDYIRHAAVRLLVLMAFCTTLLFLVARFISILFTL